MVGKTAQEQQQCTCPAGYDANQEEEQVCRSLLAADDPNYVECSAPYRGMCEWQCMLDWRIASFECVNTNECAGDYNPFHFAVENTTAWPFGADAKALEALRLVTGGEDPLPATDQDCEPALERFAKSVCAALGPPPPQNCDADMVP